MLDNVNQTHLVLVSGKWVLQKCVTGRKLARFVNQPPGLRSNGQRRLRFRPVHIGRVFRHDTPEPDWPESLLQDQDDGSEAVLRQAQLRRHRPQTARPGAR